MENRDLKNIVVLKDLPSNIVDEAIVILKSNKEARKLEFIDKKSNVNYDEKNNTNNYIIKEAESVISNYISRIEHKKDVNISTHNMELKYKKLKIYSICASIILFFALVKSLF